MKKIVSVGLLMLSGCGYSSSQNEMVGQVKKVVHNTPIICSNYVDADISLGVMKNGTGSMSHEDVWVTVDKESDIALLEKAAKTGDLVRVNYGVKRWVWCVDDHIATHVELTN